MTLCNIEFDGVALCAVNSKFMRPRSNFRFGSSRLVSVCSLLDFYSWINLLILHEAKDDRTDTLVNEPDPQMFEVFTHKVGQRGFFGDSWRFIAGFWFCCGLSVHICL